MTFLKYIAVFCVSLVLFALCYAAFSAITANNAKPNPTDKEAKMKSNQTDAESNTEPASPLAQNDILSVALLGIDRRSKAEAFRTDIMIVVAINKQTNQVVMASVPRDLWWDGGRINAAYITGGWTALQNGLAEVTGIKPEKYIMTDFEDFKWVVDAMGGVPVSVETTFTDSQYPVDETFEYQTVNFTQGQELMTGERALIFSRSRKGDNDNGDWGRMKRQHLLLKGMLTAITQPTSTFKNMEPEHMLKTVTTARMDTNLTPADATYLWDLYKDKDKYTITSMYLDYDYLFTPPMADYGGAWVLAPKDNTFAPFQAKFKNALAGIQEPKATPEQSSTDQETAASQTPATTAAQ